MLTRLLLLAFVAVLASACGGPGSSPSVDVQGPGPAFKAVDEQMQLTDEQRAALAEAGSHTEGLLQGLPTSCLLAEVAGAEQPGVDVIVAELGPDTSRGPLIAVDATGDTTLLATTLVAADGSVVDSAVWMVDGGAAISSSNELAADLTSFALEPITGTAGTPASMAMAEAMDCSWVVADLTHADPPEPQPRMRPDLIQLDPSEATPGELVDIHFPEETGRGIAFQLDRSTARGWEPVAWMTSDGSGGEPDTVPVDTEGYGWVDIGVGGPGPDSVRLPSDVPAGSYRICTANAGREFCAALEVVTS